MEKVTITREKLYKLVWLKPMTHLAKELGISDVGLRKICVRNKIPLPEYGHWQKVKSNRGSPKKELTKISGSEPIEITRSQQNSPSADRNVQFNQRTKEITDKFSSLLTGVPGSSVRHRILNELHKHLKSRNSYSTGLIESHRSNYFNLKVSKLLIEKALLFLDLFFFLCEKRGHTFKIYNQSTRLTVNGYDIEISMREKLNRTLAPDQRYYTYLFEPSGILCLKVGGYGEKEWTDQKTLLENHLPAILAFIELSAEEGNARKERNRLERELAEQKEAVRKEKFRLATQEYEKFQHLLHDATRWNQAKMVREYLAYLAESKSSSIEWLKWADKKANWLDPTINQVDELLGDYSSNPPKEGQRVG